jgi:hypothetical protein
MLTFRIRNATQRTQPISFPSPPVCLLFVLLLNFQFDRSNSRIDRQLPDPYLPNYWPDSSFECHILFAISSGIIAYVASFQNWLVVELLLPDPSPANPHG